MIMVKKSLQKWILISIGILSVVLATGGILLPLLPTTPFLLLAAACFIRSSDRLYQMLITHKWFGVYIKNYRENKAITKSSKVMILLFLWCTLGYSAIVVFSSLAIRIILIFIGMGVTFHIIRLATLSFESDSDK